MGKDYGDVKKLHRNNMTPANFCGFHTCRNKEKVRVKKNIFAWHLMASNALCIIHENKGIL